MTTTFLFESFDHLLAAASAADAKDPQNNAFRVTIRNAISNEAFDVSRGEKGRFNAKNVDKVEARLQEKFLKLVNEYRSTSLDYDEVAGLIIDLDPLKAIAWAISQKVAWIPQ